jgi:hypothetical protein
MEGWIDEKLATAFHDVPIPAGLSQRLLQRLAKNELRTKNDEVTVPSSSFLVPRSSFLVPRLSRRWVLAGGGLLAAAAGLLIAVWLGGYQKEVLNEQFVLDEAIRSFDAALEQRGQLLADRPPPAGFPISPAVLQVRGTRWRSIEGFLGCRGVVYDLPGGAEARAALFVVAAKNAKGLDAAPALHPFTTGGCCASAWQEGGLLYVLVVQGDPATYSRYLNFYRGPVA